MTVEQALKDRGLDEALGVAKGAVRSQPGSVPARTRLFQLFCLKGDWQGARRQLEILPELEHAGGDLFLAAPAFASLLDAEELRREVFTGHKAPLVFGEPPEWMGFQFEGLRLLASGNARPAAALFTQALEKAPASPGTLDGRPFAWIRDADSRFGPALEAVIGGKYYWVPLARLRLLEFDAPETLQDRVWLPATFTVENGSVLQGYVPVRYPGTESAADQELALAKATAWADGGAALSLGSGQRFWTTDAEDAPMLKTRRIELQAPG